MDEIIVTISTILINFKLVSSSNMEFLINLPPTERSEKVIKYLQSGVDKLSGRELAKSLLETDFLPPDLKEDLEDIITLGPGWCSFDGDENIEESAFTDASLLLLFYYITDQLPYMLIPSPQQTINFKYDGSTRIVDDNGTVNFFNHDTYEQRIVQLSDIIKL